MNVVAASRLALLLSRGLACIGGYRRVGHNMTIIIISAVDAENAISVRVIDKDCGRVWLRILICHTVESIIESLFQVLDLQMWWRHL